MIDFSIFFHLIGRARCFDSSMARRLAATPTTSDVEVGHGAIGAWAVAKIRYKLVVSQSLIVIKELGNRGTETQVASVAFPGLAQGRFCIMISFSLSPVGAGGSRFRWDGAVLSDWGLGAVPNLLPHDEQLEFKGRPPKCNGHTSWMILVIIICSV